MKDLAIIIPVFNEEKNVTILVNLIENVLKNVTKEYQIIFVDDGSKDQTYQVLEGLTKKNKKIEVIKFRSNFGKSAALNVGFDKCDAKYVITMDGDLQDDPREIPRFIKVLEKGYDLVSGWKKKRKDPFGKTIPSKFFNWLTSKLTKVKIHDFNCGFKAYKKEVIKDLNIYGELHRYIPALAYWKGYRVAELVVRHHPRRFGKSKYGIERLLKGFLDLLTVKYLTTYIKRPLHFFGFIGLLFSFFGGLLGSILTIQWFLGKSLSDRPILLLVALLVLVGMQFISIGLLGELIVSRIGKKSEDYNIEKEINTKKV